MGRSEEAFGAWASARDGHGQGADAELEIQHEMREHPLVTNWARNTEAQKQTQLKYADWGGGTAYSKGRHAGLGGDEGGDMWKAAAESKKKRPGKTPLVSEPKAKFYIDPPEGYRLPPGMRFE
jgi:hypothetical protein